MNKTKGFTLIELLLVISIIAILSGVLIMIINPPVLLAKARDAKRMSEVVELHKAIYLALTEGEITLSSTSGCSTCTSSTGTTAVDGTGYVKFTVPSGKTGLSKYLQVLPLDPSNSGTNVFTFGSNGTSYELNTPFESTDNTAKMTTDGGNSATLYEIGTSLTVL